MKITRLLRSSAVLMAACALPLSAQQGSAPQAQVLDLKHYSKVFGEERNYRIFLPAGYESAKDKRYPVVYFFHGHSERYNKSPSRGGYDQGDEYKGDNIASFVARNDVIVVKWDGYNPRTPGEAYPRPYNIYPVETYRQFPLYFPELVEYIDSHYRTIADRDHRGTAGLSMGGFMSYWVSGKYPHLVCSASNFMGSSEFWAGPNGFPSEYRHTEMYRNYEGIRTRIVMGSKDFIRWYHRRMNAMWDFTRPYHEHETFEWDHGTPGMTKTLAFHMAAFQKPLPKPSLWHHADIYPTFEVWGFSVSTDRNRSGYTFLENVSRSGFRCSVREWLPEGKLMPDVNVDVTTDAAYSAGAEYAVTDVNLDSGEVRTLRLKADEGGRLRVPLTGARHEVGITDSPRPLLTVSDVQVAGSPWAVAGKPVRLKLTILNKGNREARNVVAEVRSPNPGVKIDQGKLTVRAIPAAARLQPGEELLFNVQDPDREVVKFEIRLKDSLGAAADIPIEVPMFRDAPVLTDFTVMDGQKLTIWERAVQKSEKSLGSGNGDASVNPGEAIAIAVRDGDAFRPVELFTSDSCVDLSNRAWDPWAAHDHVGATAKISLPVISSRCPAGREIPFFVRYQLPKAPEHIQKEGVIRVKVSGHDHTAPDVAWAKVRDWNRLEAGLSDSGKVVKAVARLTQGNAILEVPLNDAGRLGDGAPEDGIFTGLLPNPAAGHWELTISAQDEFGNAGDRVVSGDFVFEMPAPSPVLSPR